MYPEKTNNKNKGKINLRVINIDIKFNYVFESKTQRPLFLLK